MYNITFGDGYGVGELPLPIDFNDDGTISPKGYTPTPTSSTGGSSTGGIGIRIPPADDEMPWEPIIPEVAPPTAMFDLVSYEGYNVQFINESLGNIDSLLWDFGDGTFSTEESPLYTYAEAGTYIVRLWVSNAGGDDYHSESVITVDPTPSIGFNFAIGGYTGYFTNLSNTADYLWDFGDGQTSTARFPKHTYATTGDYTVTLKTGGLTLSKTVKIDVEILLEWTDNSDNEDGFKIERSPNGTDGWEEIAVITSPDIESYGVTKAKDGVDSAVINFFRVLAYSGAGESGYSNIANVRCS